ncbi:MAG: hypothetical protein U9R51_07795 [Actinomycetota bacterium]|nr:hypothetical protein [Actinomycetota bacterium]
MVRPRALRYWWQPQAERHHLQWILEGAIAEGLIVDDDGFEPYRCLPETNALADLWISKGTLWAILGRRDRKILPDGAIVHESVIIRRDRLPKYRPNQPPDDPPIELWPR